MMQSQSRQYKCVLINSHGSVISRAINSAACILACVPCQVDHWLDPPREGTGLIRDGDAGHALGTVTLHAINCVISCLRR